jgi:hypothetical protein
MRVERKEGEKEMQYKIETKIDGNWTDDGVGNPNEFDTREEAEQAIPELARIFDSPENEFRVAER